MAQPMPPPRGFFIPTRMIFKSQMPPAVFLTWLQLRSLTWRGQDIPPISVQAWVDLTGISRVTFIRHLNWLRDVNALCWHSSSPGKVCIIFKNDNQPIDPVVQVSGNNDSISENPNCSKMDNSKMNSSKMNNPPSLKSPINIDTLQIPVIAPDYQEFEQNPVEQGEGWGKRECEGERGDPGDQNCNHQGTHIPVILYRSIVHLMPNKTQQRIIESTVADLHIWQQTLEHWLGHGWNPKNITGMLQLYERGGASGCRACRSEDSPGHQRKTTHQQTLDAFESLRKKRTNPLNQD
jgi:hypothetical protein